MILNMAQTEFTKLVKNIKGHTYFDLLIYNDLYQNKDKDNIKIETSLDSLISIYDKLFGFGFSLAGYQFIGLVLEKSIMDNDNKYAPAAYFMLAIGFLISLFGSMSSFFILEFLISIKQEENNFIIHSIQKYKTIFKIFSESLLYMDCILFLLPINILIHNVLSYYYGLIFNICSGILFLLGLIFSYCTIIAKQIFTDKEGNKIKRLIYDINK